MAALANGGTDDPRRAAVSPRPKGRENVRGTLCRNVTIYGHCRYENKGCTFNHPRENSTSEKGMKMRFNADSPSFTPAVQSSPSLSVSQLNANAKSASIPLQAANAAPFRPDFYNGTPDPASDTQSNATDWSSTIVSENVACPMCGNQPNAPQNTLNANHNTESSVFNAFQGNMMSTGSLIATGNSSTYTPNPLTNALQADSSQNYTQSDYSGTQSQFLLPQYHLYASFGPKRQDLAPHQRAAQDFFVPDDLREDLQKKSHAANQTLQVGVGLITVGAYHTFVPLEDTSAQSTTTFGYNTSLYKVCSSKDGNLYALRRIEGFVLYDENVIYAWRRWKDLRNPNIVSAFDMFSGGPEFGDGLSSLCIITSYYPLSTTLASKHLTAKSSRFPKPLPLPDTNTLWTYVVQIANALRAIHTANLAARMLEPNKIILTAEKRIRLNLCGIADVTNTDGKTSIKDQQSNDLVQFGRLIITLGAGPPVLASNNMDMILNELQRRHGNELAERVTWLLNPHREDHRIEAFLQSIQTHVMDVFNATMNLEGELEHNLYRELENSRLVRLMTKLDFVTERPEDTGNTLWSEWGERYPIKLFRDFVFHQRHADGAPSLDLAHVIACLNKLDAGSEEKVVLRNDGADTNMLVSYKELKRLITSAFDDLKLREKRRR